VINKRCAAKFIRPAAGHDIYNGTLISAVLSREVIRDYLKLLDKLRVRNEVARATDRKVIVVGAIIL